MNGGWGDIFATSMSFVSFVNPHGTFPIVVVQKVVSCLGSLGPKVHPSGSQGSFAYTATGDLEEVDINKGHGAASKFW